MKVLYFAWLAERLGVPEETIEETVEADLLTADDLRLYLQARHPEQAEIFARQEILRVAVNKQLVQWDHPVSVTDEVALFPPMTGG